MAGIAGKSRSPFPDGTLSIAHSHHSKAEARDGGFSLALLRLQDQTCLTEFCAPGLFSWCLDLFNSPSSFPWHAQYELYDHLSTVNVPCQRYIQSLQCQATWTIRLGITILRLLIGLESHLHATHVVLESHE
jgi:hypothetical protein